MNKVQCTNPDNAHFFDADQYTKCPHCGYPKADFVREKKTGLDLIAASCEKEEKSKKIKKGWFGKSKNCKSETSQTTEKNTIETEQILTQPSQSGVEVDADEIYWKLQEKKYPKTDVLGHESGRFTQEQIKNDKEPFQLLAEKMENMEASPKVTTPIPAVRKTDLDEVKTQTAYTNEDGEEPVTGWLVCTKGVYKGKSFCLKTGNNIIGRNEKSADICLRKDEQVSREKHARVIFEPKRCMFYLAEGESSMTYLNGELVFGSHELSSYDTIEMGGGVYLFVPFCGEQFAWNIQE